MMTDYERHELLLKAKPILFNTEMVRSILDGRKTVTRRIVKNNPEECTSKVVNGVCKICDDKGGFYLPDDYVKVRSPYQVGDILYVRETWSEVETVYGVPYYIYKADDKNGMHSSKSNFSRWFPSIHMPKEVARIFLRVTNVRVEKLQEITEDDIVDEGAEKLILCPNEHGVIEPDGTLGDMCWNAGCCGGNCKYIDKSYGELFGEIVWDRTIKKSDLDKYGWAANPFVWVIEFERIN